MTDTETTADPISAFAKAVWWLVLLRGIAAIALGILAFVAPVATTLAFVFVYGAYALVDGVFAIVHAIGNAGRKQPYGFLLFQGILGVIAGIVAFVFPVLAGTTFLLVLLWIIAISAIMQGILTLAALPATGKAWAVVTGVLNIAFGVIMGVITWTNPLSALAALIWVVAIWAIILGAMLVAISFQVRAAAKAA